jgi:hypothetical protein
MKHRRPAKQLLHHKRAGPQHLTFGFAPAAVDRVIRIQSSLSRAFAVADLLVIGASTLRNWDRTG